MDFLKDLTNRGKMQYNRIYVEDNKGYFDLLFEGEHDDTTGLGGKWEAKGNLLKVYPTSGFLVIVNPLNQKPLHVVASVEDLNLFIKEKYKVDIEWNSLKNRLKK